MLTNAFKVQSTETGKKGQNNMWQIEGNNNKNDRRKAVNQL